MAADYRNRTPAHPIHEQFWRRWSPRAMSGAALTTDELNCLIEAARWAPSSYNRQPWRFIYALRGSEAFDSLFNLLAGGNQAWCKNAGALIVLISEGVFEPGKASITNSLDAGAAWMSLSLQGHHMGLVVHGLQGFDYDKARRELGVPDTFEVEMMIALGHPGAPSTLPEWAQSREVPNERKPIEELAMEGRFVG